MTLPIKVKQNKVFMNFYTYVKTRQMVERWNKLVSAIFKIHSWGDGGWVLMCALSSGGDFSIGRRAREPDVASRSTKTKAGAAIQIFQG